MALSSIWAIACSKAIRPLSFAVIRRRGTSRGGNSAGLAGRAGRAGGGVSPSSTELSARQLATSWLGKLGFLKRVCCVQRSDDAGCQGNVKRHRLHGFDKFENFGGMPIDFDFWPDSGDVAGAIDDKGGALNAHIGFAIH